ncbi:hypothetical protein FKW77_006292 [Venturia effusa]|uniref:HECT-type E3 ubiquitin transferase n=1 Tax=Venturia effusa TaxID=50376 RepID=A0A517LDX5_9PEZI|nr:hypothetical protein FKW77_006292 [Venturia effusa]
MGKISKTAGERHEATLSPVISEFVRTTSTIPLRQLNSQLNKFDKLWPFPRGDLYHWIPVLNRFDGILDLFTREYGLDKGPQTHKFGSAVLDKGDKTEPEPRDSNSGELDESATGDCDLVLNILAFSRMLVENCGNRSLYSSSDRLNDILNTTSLPLLISGLQLALLLAKRYHSSKTRFNSIGGNASLAGHYNISLDRVRRLAASFVTPAPPLRVSVTGSIKGKEKGGRSSRTSIVGGSDPKVQGADLAALVRLNAPDSEWRAWGDVTMSFYKSQDVPKDIFDQNESAPSTPSIRRTSNLVPTATPNVRTPAAVAHDSTPPSIRPGSADQGPETPVQNGSSSVEINLEQVSQTDSEDLLKRVLGEHSVPDDATYELLHKVRIAKAISSSKINRCSMVAIRLLAVANLAYVDSDSTFQSKFSQSDSEQPRRLQLAYQLAELVQPPDGDDDCSSVPLDLQTVALTALEGLAKQKSRSNDVYTALNANVNHGILFYLARKVVTQLEAEEAAMDQCDDTETGSRINEKELSASNVQEENWRHALFLLLTALPNTMPRASDSMVSAGLLDILVEILALRTSKAERAHGKVLQFLDTFLYGARDGYQALANAKGLDVIRDLMSYVVKSSLERAQSGHGMPVEFKAPVIDYQIPFFQQVTLRWMFKFVNHLMSHNSANFGRQMRNLIDSAEVLDSLRQVLSNADIYGSNVWASSVAILTSFIHNEPTSYSVIAESRLGESFLTSITKDKSVLTANAEAKAPEEPGEDWTPALLPVSEAITAVPQAFQALCLNEAGMKLVTESHALSFFFRIFESPAHVKTMEQDPELPAHLGNVFDELVRHQPTLKPEILIAVQNTVQRVGKLCHSSAAENGYGAKLWDRVDDQLVIAGGAESLKIRPYESLTQQRTDMDVADDGTPMSIDQLHEKQGADQGPHPTAYLSAFARFLAGFLQNAPMCTAFIENGGLEYALDFATSPCLPYNFDRISNGSLSETLVRMFVSLIEMKPFIVLPAILKRIRGALIDLEPLLEHNSSSPFFRPFTQDTDAAESNSNALISHGTRYAKALVVVNVLCGVLSGAFGSQMYSHRSHLNIFDATNLADVYESLISGLGKLHSSCIWEGCQLVNSIPEDVERETHLVATGFGAQEVDNALHISAPTSVSTKDSSSTQINDSKGPKTESKEVRNTRVIRFLMYQGPHEISQFFQALGKVLLVRRTSDPYKKANAFKVADSMASAAIRAMQYATEREGPLDRPTPQVVTLVLQSFKNQGGFETLETVLESFFTEAKRLIEQSSTSVHNPDLDVATGGVKVILEFYSRVINSKYVVGATQTDALATRSQDKDKPDYFHVGQLLVELRLAIIKPVKKMWSESESAFMDKAPTSIVKSLVEILRIELESESEVGAFSRSDKIPKRPKPEPKKWMLKSPENSLNILETEFARDLAFEALFRCYESISSAREYCRIVSGHERSQRTPIPPDLIETPQSRTSPQQVEAGTTAGSLQARPPSDDSSVVQSLDALTTGRGFSLSGLFSAESGTDLMAQPTPVEASDSAEMPDTRNSAVDGVNGIFDVHQSRDASASPAQGERVEAGTLPNVITVEDLNEERVALRQTLIDRCLDVLNVHDDVTFDLSDLISAAVAKQPSSGNLRQEIGSTILMSLTSLQMDDDMSEDATRRHSRKVASYAHLFALVIQDPQFYTAIKGDLYESFSLLVGFIKVRGSQKIQDTALAMAQVLLILERLLTDDATPKQIEYKLPSPDSVSEGSPVAKPLSSSTIAKEKEELLNAIMNVLPHVAKDESLPLSITRILVILTRDRDLATLLGRKENIRRLFSMMKQLHGAATDKLQSAFLLVLRHIIEDDDTLRDIMRSDIQAMFETRTQRQIDTTHYTRNMYHLVIRSPSMFVEVTNEKVMLSKYEPKHGPQNLTLKKDSPTSDAPTATSDDASRNAEPKVFVESRNDDKKEKTEAEKSKGTELKMPEVKHPDGVIHFILNELLSIKDVDDPNADTVAPSIEKTLESVSKSPDVEMSDSASSSSTSQPFTTNDRKPDKTEFKAENHFIYIYRCFLLQCLTELMSSYNRAKVEFINFKRNADPQATTPSKPRSSVLNYLLNTLIPTGTLVHASDITSQKRNNVSNWAIAAIVALCSKTGEQPYARSLPGQKDYDEEPDLLFVRKFVLEHAIRAFKDAHSNSTDTVEHKYARLLNLSDLFHKMLTGRPNNAGDTGQPRTNAGYLEMLMHSQRILSRIMYEKNLISALTASIAEIDLNFPGAKRAVKYILKPLKLLTTTANEISLTSENPIVPGSGNEDEISSESSASNLGDAREETPDLFRNSALGILDPGREDDTDSDEDDEDDDEEMYDEEEYEDQMDYEEGHDHDEVVSDEEQEIDEMGPVEGLPGDVAMDIIPMDIHDLEDGEDMTDSDDDSDDMDDDDDAEEDEDDDDDDDDDNDDLDIGEEGEDLDDFNDREHGEHRSIGADDEDWESDGGNEEGFPGLVDLDASRDLSRMPQLDDLVRLGGPELLQHLEEGGLEDGEIPHAHAYIEEEMPEEDEGEEEDYDEEDIGFEAGMDDDEIEMRGLPWGWGEEPPRHTHHHHHLHPHGGRHGNPWGGLFTHHVVADRPFPPSYRTHRQVGTSRVADEGINPLLQRRGQNARNTAGHRRYQDAGLPGSWNLEPDLIRPGRITTSSGDGPMSFLNNLINMMTAGGVPAAHNGTIQLHIAPGMLGGASGRELDQILRVSGRRPAESPSRTSRDDPTQAVRFEPGLTTTRWQEEARLLFGPNVQEMALRVVNAILQHLVPPAIEAQKRRDKEEAERQQKVKEEREAAAKAKAEAEQKEREEKEAREKQEKEEREAIEAEAAALRSQEQAEHGSEVVGSSVDTEGMEGVEQSQPIEASEGETEEPEERVTITIEGQEVDITHLGIDLEYLQALPDELRREVLMEQTLQQRSQVASTGQESNEISPEFLEALPPNLRDEIVQQEAIERRRRDREEARRQAVASGAASAARGPEDMDTATFFATLDPQLRAQLLMEVNEEQLNTFPADLQAEARALTNQHRRLDHSNFMDLPRARGRGLDRELPGGVTPDKRKPTQYVQILDKAGVATLLRLMFVPQSGSAKTSLQGILRDVCQNKQNRAEVVSILLSILQDGSNDINAIERSFAQLTLRAKQPAVPKTPQPKRASPELTSGVGEMSPLMVVQQCLSTLDYLTQYNSRIAEFFLTEHETGAGFKPRSARKGKGKETKASKYPINALLGLLDRKLVIESAPVMEQLASLLQRITIPLKVLKREDKDGQLADENTAANTDPTTEQVEAAALTTTPEVAQATALADVVVVTVNEPVSIQPSAITNHATDAAAEPNNPEEPAVEEEEKTKKHRTMTPPEVPDANLRLIINIIAARECPSKTFQQTLSLITNLSAIPEAKKIFGKELIHQAQGLGLGILKDLAELSAQISKSSSGTDVQGMALAKFSPASSDQAKLLRVITALDWMFDPKHSNTTDHSVSATLEGLELQQKEDILTTLYENSTFGSLWNNLSECLTAIRKRGNMFNVANILLPLIEVLMVVCKNTTLKDAPAALTAQKEFALSSPEPESREARMESLFFTFTEEHRKVLNDLVRHNPKLMSGSFSLLVKNSKVLEFDNKRNYFQKKLHSRNNELRQPQPSLQLSVRRDQVFLDSFKSLYYKKADEFKYGKLSIRFSGEEGVDAGGVSREWFQVLTKQMFDPNYALFNPVASDRTTFHPNPQSDINEQHLMFFKFIGRIIGKSLYEGRVLDCHFSRAVYKRILGKAISIKDMESLDLEYYKSLQWIMENDISDVIEETFSVETERFGEHKVEDLIENGRNIPVTEANKMDYVRANVEYKLIGSVKEQLDSFLQGFHDIVQADLISIFNEQELELLISGLPDIDVDDWKNNTEYHNYQASSPQIQWFWRAVRSFEKEERAKLLQFVTGTSKVPLNGFKELEGMNGFSRFNIHRDYGSKDRLPSSHTCFNQLDLPEYESYEDLRKALYTAMTAGSEYFGFA